MMQTFFQNHNVRAGLLLSAIILGVFSLGSCKTEHVIHIHNGVPVTPDDQESTEPKPTEELPVDITMILDHSGSMATLSEQVIESFNDFLEEQKTVDGEAAISLVQFNQEYSPVYAGVDIQEAEKLNAESYISAGRTALFDAIGRTIAETKERIARGSADVVFVITTDGLENASSEYTGSQIKEMIEECKSEFGWHFMYLAANDDAYDQYHEIGLSYGNTYKLDNTPESYRHSQELMSIQMNEFRNTRDKYDLEFNDEDRIPEE